MPDKRSKKSAARSTLSRSDIDLLCIGSRHLRRQKARQPRTMDLSGFSFVVTHKPTGVTIKAEMPMGHYSRTDVRDFEAALLVRLEEAVAKARRLKSNVTAHGR